MESKGKDFTRNLVFQSFAIFIGTAMIYGYNFSALNLPVKFIKEFYNATYTERGSPLTSYMSTFLFSFTVTVYLAGCFFGTLFGGCVSKRIGRKKLVLLCQIPHIIGSILQTICLPIKSPESLMIGRFISGLGTGTALQIAPVFVSELSPQSIRGTMISGNGTIAVVGILLSGIFGLDKIFGTEKLWIYILLIPVIPSLFCTIMLAFVRESPRFLLLDMKDQLKAEKALQFLRQQKDVSEEIVQIKNEVAANKTDKTERYTLWQMMKKKEYRLPLILTFALPVSLQATAMSGVFFYTPAIFQSIGLREGDIQYSVLGMYGCLLVGTLLATSLIDRLGRRPLLLFPMSVITVLLLILTLCNNLQKSAPWLAYIGVVSVLIFGLLFTLGPGNLVWVIPPELFKQGPRDVAASFSVVTIWISMLISAVTFEFMADFTRNLVCQSFAIFIGTSLIYGYNLSTLNLPVKFIKEFYNATYTERGSPLTSYMSTFLFSLTVTVYLAGSFFGTLFGGCVSKRTGRKKLVLLCQIPHILGSILQTISLPIRSPESLIIGRFVSGLGTGTALQIAPVYISELSPKSIRGTMISGNGTIAALGSLLSVLFGLDKIFGTEKLWIYILLIPVLPSLLCSIMLVFVRESPRFLLLDRKDQLKAEKALQFLRQQNDVSEEIGQIQNEVAASKTDPEETYTLWQMMKKKEYRLPLILAFALPVSLQTTAIPGVFFYTPAIFQSIGLGEEEIQYSILGMFVSLLIGTLLSTSLIDRLGRRPLLISTMSIIAILLLILTLCTHLQKSAPWLAYIGVVCVLVFGLSFTLGPGSLVWVIPPELFKQGPRDVAASFSVVTLWITIIIFAVTFEFMADAMGSFVFLLFMALTFCFTLLFFWKLPETKDRAFEEIANMVKGCVCVAIRTGAIQFSKPKMESKRKDFTRNLVIQCFAIYIGTCFNYGYNFMALNLPVKFIKEFYNATYTERGVPLTSYMSTFLFSLTVMLYPAGCFFGTLFGGCVSKSTGRKKLVLLCQIPQILGSILQTICVAIRSPESLLVGRFVSGLGTGTALQIAPVYVSELSPKRIRGTLLSGNGLTAVLGVLLSGTFGLDKILGTEKLWFYILLIPVMTSLLCTKMLVAMRESPRFLLLDKKEPLKAEKALQFLRQRKDVSKDIMEIENEAAASETDQTEKFTLWQLIKAKEHRLPLVLTFSISFSMQSTGMSGVFFYTPSIFQSIGLSEGEIQYSVLGMLISLFIGAMLSAILVDRLGRRPLLLSTMSVITVLLLILTLCNHFQKSAPWLAYIGVVCVFIFAISATIGSGNLAWVIPPELFKQGPRDVAASFSAVVIWVSMLIFSVTFEFMADAMGSFVFLVFMALTFGFTLLFFWKLPETNGKAFEEIADMVSRKEKALTKE